MTWLSPLPPGDTGWYRLAALQPGLVSALSELQRTTWTLVDPAVLELCRIRIAMLLGSPADQRLRAVPAVEAGLTETRVAALTAWPTSPLFSDGDRACLGLTEQFVIDVQGITDEQVAAVTHYLGEQQCFVLVNALWSMEALQRACIVLGIEPALETIGS
jgi:alkylhydroperoxidase family enzyme